MLGWCVVPVSSGFAATLHSIQAATTVETAFGTDRKAGSTSSDSRYVMGGACKTDSMVLFRVDERALKARAV